jgi:hypothetical protein
MFRNLQLSLLSLVVTFNAAAPMCFASDPTGIEQPKLDKSALLKGSVKETNKADENSAPTLQKGQVQSAAPSPAKNFAAAITTATGASQTSQSQRGKKYIATENNPFSEPAVVNGRRVMLRQRGLLGRSPYFKAWQNWEHNVYTALAPHVDASLNGRDYIGLVCFDLIVAQNGDIKSMSLQSATGRDADAIVTFGRQFIAQNHTAQGFAFPGDMGVQLAHIYVFFDFY